MLALPDKKAHFIRSRGCWGRVKIKDRNGQREASWKLGGGETTHLSLGGSKLRTGL